MLRTLVGRLAHVVVVRAPGLDVHIQVLAPGELPENPFCSRRSADVSGADKEHFHHNQLPDISL
jgi:hypothetical protein